MTELTDNADGTLDHLVRTMPPWNTGPEMTECGRPVTDVKSITTREAVKAKITRHGKARAAFTTCMTCAQTSDRYVRAASWRESAVTVVERWAQRAAWRRSEDSSRQTRELLAVGMLLDEHREEFEGLVTALEQTPNLDDARRRARIRQVRG